MSGDMIWPGQPAAPGGRRGHVLIVSNRALRAGVYAVALALQGFTIRSVSDAEMAGHGLETKRYDVVLADCQEPVLANLLRQLRAIGGGTPAVLMLDSYAADPLAPALVDGPLVALPKAAPLADVISAVSALADGAPRDFSMASTAEGFAPRLGRYFPREPICPAAVGP